MATTEAEVITAVRTELGDLPEPFRDSFRGNGTQVDYDLPARNLKADSVEVFRVLGDGGIENFTQGTDYTLDTANGLLRFVEPPEEDAQIVVSGTSFGIFTDAEMAMFIEGALAQHLKGRTTQIRYRDGHGFIKYDREPMTLETMPSEEKILVSILATVEALWALSTDAATDIDIQTAEGTSIPRGQRWRQLTAQIDLLQDKYVSLSQAMGVGLYAPEVFDLRRVSRQTGRLVPVFQEREYDENGPPIRKLPPAHTRDVDPDGPASPFWSGGWGF